MGCVRSLGKLKEKVAIVSCCYWTLLAFNWIPFLDCNVIPGTMSGLGVSASR